MKADPARLVRLKRLERMRNVARQRALENVSSAEMHYTRLKDLAQRSGAMAQGFAGRIDAHDAGALRDLRAFHAALSELSQTTAQDTASARRSADARQAELVRAERSRDLVTERLNSGLRNEEKNKTTKRLADQAHLARSLNRFG